MRNLVRYCCSGVFALLLWGSSNAVVRADAGVSPKEAAAMQSSKNAIIVDVREDNEWQEQHIPGALHIPLSQLDSRMGELKGRQHGAIVMQCRSGKRSAKAQAALQSAGFANVYNMEGGLLAWQQQGLSVE
ncbi:MAG: rhodanese-like domain-containing protein [Methylovulum miyakonense]|uniref:rhodanese-like domain-containing protein n=1 Tax=Methylovulum miyakonense TaxID=645578 RepID=UPI003BB791BD